VPRTELRAEVEIDAPLSHVYGVLTDFPRYSEWNPFITAIAGKLVEGEQLTVDLSLPEGSSHELKPRLMQVSENAELRWRGHFWLPSLLQAEHFFQLEGRGATLTRFVQGQNFSGFLLRFASKTVTQTARGLVYMNQALKKRAESSWRAAG
jgi:hypothetical protein